MLVGGGGAASPSSGGILFNSRNETDSSTYSFRPVFLINPTAKIKSGSGTEQNPYILEAGE